MKKLSSFFALAAMAVSAPIAVTPLHAKDKPAPAPAAETSEDDAAAGMSAYTLALQCASANVFIGAMQGGELSDETQEQGGYWLNLAEVLSEPVSRNWEADFEFSTSMLLSQMLFIGNDAVLEFQTKQKTACDEMRANLEK